MALTQISTAGVKDDAISAGKIPANAVGSSEIADDAVGAAQIADDGVAQAAVADEAIDEARLQISNAGSNGQFLQKQSGNTGGVTWAAANQYTHPNHSGEVTSSADGATTIASNIVDEDNLKISNAGTNGQYLQKQSGNTGGLTWADVTIPPAGNTFDLVADGAIAAGKPVIIKSNGKAEQVKISTTELTTQGGTMNGGNGYTVSDPIYHFCNRIAYNPDDDMYVAISVQSGSSPNDNFVYQLGIPNSDATSDGGIAWYAPATIHGGNSHRHADICYAGNSRFLIVYEDVNAGKTVQRILKWSGSSASLSSDATIDGESSNTYRDPRMVKIADDRIAIMVRQASGGKFTNGYAGIIVGDITNDTTWTYRNSEVAAAYTTQDSDYNSIGFDSTNSIILASWKNSGDTLRAKAFKVASGTSATITKSTSEAEFGPSTDARTSKHIWHSGQSKWITVYTYTGSTDTITSKIATIDTTSLAITYGSAIDVSSQDVYERNDNLVLTITNTGTIYAYWITKTNPDRTVNAMLAANFNGSTLSWTTPSSVWGGMQGYIESIDGLFVGADLGNRNILFGETYQSKPSYITFKTTSESTNLDGYNQNFLGFAEDAISDGNTGTIKLSGNVVGNQSGLTPGTWYAVSGSGTLSSGGSNSSAGGLAVASDKLKIKEVPKS